MDITGQNKLPQDAIYTVGIATVSCCQSQGNAKETVLTEGWIHKNYKHLKSQGVCVTECMKITTENA